MPRPNLFIIGAMKAGSTTLHEYLETHPQIFMSPEKEPGFFVPKVWGDRPESEYIDLFSAATNEKYRGESSTHYSKIPTFCGIPEQIAAYSPDARLLYILRHPIKRAISQYFHMVRAITSVAESRDIMTALREEPWYVAYSDYAMQLEAYLAVFEKQQIRTVVLEEFIRSPQSHLSDLSEWLAIDDFPDRAATISANQAPPEFQRVAGYGILNQIRNSATWHRISPLVPKALRNLGRSVSQRNATAQLTEAETEAVYSYLRPIAEDMIARLSAITNRDYSIWDLNPPSENR